MHEIEGFILAGVLPDAYGTSALESQKPLLVPIAFVSNGGANCI